MSKLLDEMESMKRIAAEVVPKMAKLRKQAQQRIAAQAAVVEAAKDWVNFEDTGSAGDMGKLGLIQERLVRAVQQLEKLERQ